MIDESEYQRDTVINSGDFTSRLIDQFFLRWVWYMLPVVLLATLGVRIASNVTETFVARGTLSASENPLVDSPEVRGTTIGAFEPPAVGIARLINEQLQSDAFVQIVADRSGLDALLASNTIEPDVIRQQISATAQGENLLSVRASWGDPETAYLLVDATINGYLDLLTKTVAIDSVEAIDFWTRIRGDAEERANAADLSLRAFIETLPVLPNGEQYTAAQELDLTRRNATLDAALIEVREAQARIDSAMLTVEQSTSEAGRQVRVVDPPQRAEAPTPETFRKITTIMMFTLIGVIVGAAALLVTTMMDSSVRSVAQLRAATGASSTAIVPRSKLIRNWAQSHGQVA